MRSNHATDMKGSHTRRMILPHSMHMLAVEIITPPPGPSMLDYTKRVAVCGVFACVCEGLDSIFLSGRIKSDKMLQKKKSPEKCINNPPAVSQKASHLPYKANVLVNRLSVMFRAGQLRSEGCFTAADYSSTGRCFYRCPLSHAYVVGVFFLIKVGRRPSIWKTQKLGANSCVFNFFSCWSFFEFIFPHFLFIFFSLSTLFLTNLPLFFTVWKNVTQEK